MFSVVSVCIYPHKFAVKHDRPFNKVKKKKKGTTSEISSCSLIKGTIFLESDVRND